MIGIRLSQDVCIPGLGVRKSRQVVSQSDCGDSWQWLVDNRFGTVLSEADFAAAVEVPVPEASEDIDDEDQDEDGDDESDDEQTDNAESSSTETEKPESGEPEATTAEPLTEDQASVLKQVKDHLATGKAQLKTILLETGLTEDVVAPVMTEANGIRKNQQGWYGLI